MQTHSTLGPELVSTGRGAILALELQELARNLLEDYDFPTKALLPLPAISRPISRTQAVGTVRCCFCSRTETGWKVLCSATSTADSLTNLPALPAATLVSNLYYPGVESTAVWAGSPGVLSSSPPPSSTRLPVPVNPIQFLPKQIGLERREHYLNTHPLLWKESVTSGSKEGLWSSVNEVHCCGYEERCAGFGRRMM
ncbi:hypothetical protein Bbelb_150220 [Branchiostoma belcheri]|nr:hypothetical protein Bbelb_150220 [Branchiostoma belcheri]